MDYQEFLETKRLVAEPVGFEVDREDLNPMLFDWQKDIVVWALRRGRAALFEDCGLGKTPQQLEWAHQIHLRTKKPILILTPLAVHKQTEREAKKFHIPAKAVTCADDVVDGINITNYEKLHHFDSEAFGGIVLDESSILKSFNGKTRTALTEFAKDLPYRLCCSATPAPNDLIELLNHAEFLNIMSVKEIIALFFTQDGNTTHKWKLKGHAHDTFYQWMAEWSVALRKPSDLGYEDGGFILPKLTIEQTTVQAPATNGQLLPTVACTLQEERDARKATLEDRVKVAANVANNYDGPVLVWCNLNIESAALKKAIPDGVEVKGSDSEEHKTNSIIGFSNGDIRVLISKPSICGWGMNWQHCDRMAFVGISHSYEQYYQAIRRCWRFGQTKPVKCTVVVSTAEGKVVENIKRKEKQADKLFNEIIANINLHQTVNQAVRKECNHVMDMKSGDGWDLLLGDSCERIKEIEDESIGLSVFSPPFPGMYAYTNSARDIGNCASINELLRHFRHLIPEIYRITKPGRSCAIHLTQAPLFKGTDGHVGLKDFRGKVIRQMEREGWIYYGEHTIDKDPQVKASRTKDHTLLFKTLSKDSSKCRAALADYMLQFMKPGVNDTPVEAGTHPRWNPDGGWISSEEWCEWAAPVWYRKAPKNNRFPNYPARDMATDGIKETEVLQVRGSKDKDDEKHLCPLQLGVIERCIKLWTAPGDIVFSPFAGIGSEGYMAVTLHRKFKGIELKKAYWKVAGKNLERAEHIANTTPQDLFSASKSEK